MRIVSALFAVLGLTAVVANVEYFNETFSDYLESHRNGRHPRRIHKKNEHTRMQEIECCPTVLEMVEPVGGKNQDGIFVELYRDNNYRQRFYELSCPKEVLNKPCKFINKKMHAQSMCVQKTSYTYALVKDTPDHRNKNLPMFPTPGAATYTLDYIQVRSGCSCVVVNNSTMKRKRNKKKSALLSDPP